MPFPSLNDGMARSELRWRRMTREAREGQPAVPQVPPNEGFRYWVDYLKFRVSKGYDAVVLVTGDEGTGKSTFTMRLSEALERGWDPSSLCYDPKEVLQAYRVAASRPKGTLSVIVYDEGVRGLLAGDTFTAPQRTLVQALMLVREIGAVLIICAPDIWRVAKAVRGRRATLWIHVTDRGEALVHERDVRIRYKRDDTLGLTVSPRAPNLTWKPYPPDTAIWKRYVAIKNDRLKSYLAEATVSLGGDPDEDTAAVIRAERARQQRERRSRRRAEGKKPN